MACRLGQHPNVVRMPRRIALLCPLLTVLLAGCDGGARPDADAQGITVIATPDGDAANVLNDRDLHIHKAAVQVEVPSARLLVITTLVFRNRSLDRTLSSESLILDATGTATQVPVAAMILDPHGPLRPQADDWLLTLPQGDPLAVHDSPELRLDLLPLPAVAPLGTDYPVILAIDPDGPVTLPPVLSDITRAHIAALILVRISQPVATDTALAAIYQAGVLVAHAHVAITQPLSLSDSHYLGLLHASP